MKSKEHDEQCALFEWSAYMEGKYPCLSVLYAVPNGGKRDAITGAKLKAEGARAGVSDIHLPVPLHGYSGLWIELKIKPNKPTDAQIRWIEQMKSYSHAAFVAYSCTECINIITNYILGCLSNENDGIMNTNNIEKGGAKSGKKRIARGTAQAKNDGEH